MPADHWGPEIIIADQDGSNRVTLQAEHAPYPIPRPQAEYAVELLQMRAGADGPGYRVAQLGGATRNEQDLELSVALLSPEQFEILEAKYYRQPPEPLAYTLDGGATWCLAVWQRQGWIPSNQDDNWTAQSAVIKLHKLGEIEVD